MKYKRTAGGTVSSVAHFNLVEWLCGGGMVGGVCRITDQCEFCNPNAGYFLNILRKAVAL